MKSMNSSGAPPDQPCRGGSYTRLDDNSNLAQFVYWLGAIRPISPGLATHWHMGILLGGFPIRLMGGNTFSMFARATK
jgi:hypothetical protein